MAANFRILEGGRVVHYLYEDPWTLEKALAVNDNARMHYDSVTHRVHAIIDLRNAKSAPAGVLRTRNAPSLTHSNAGHMVVLGANSLLKTMGDVASRLAGYNRLIFCTTEEQALAEVRAIIADEMATIG
jgi:hypothetical protein